MRKAYSATELARYLGVSNAAITKWVKAGCPHSFEGMRYSFDVASVFLWLKQRSERHRKFAEHLEEKLAHGKTKKTGN